MQRRDLPACALAHRFPRPLAQAACIAVLAFSSCVDSDPPSQQASVVSPPLWSTRPGKIETFSAFDPGKPTATYLWSTPPEVKNLAQGANDVTLVSKSAVGTFELIAFDTAGGPPAGTATIQVVDYSFGFSLALGYSGSANHTVHGDVDVVQGAQGGPAPGDPGNIWVAYFNPDSTETFVKLYESDFVTELQSFPAVYNTTKLPEIAADAQGAAYWIEAIPGANFRLVQARPDGTSQQIDLTAVLASLQLSPHADSDIALTAAGELVFECIDATQNRGFYRIVDAFGAAPQAFLIFPSDQFANVQLDIDAQGRLLFGDNEVPTLRRVTGEGANATIEDLELIQDTIVDVDEDQQGALYVTTPRRVIVLDTEGDVVFEITQADVLDNNGNLVAVPFEQLVGASLDVDGNLRVIDGRLTDIPNLPVGVVASYNFTINLQ
jgi:hypothetical protein